MPVGVPLKPGPPLRVLMEAQEAVERAQAHLKNAMELAQRPVGKEDLLYMWDNQISTIDSFLADTEVVRDKLLDRARESLRKVKKDLQDTVVKFEAEQEGEEIDLDDDVPDDEWVTTYTEMVPEMLALAKEALDEKVEDVEDILKWEEALAQLNGFLADSEPFQELDRELRKARSVVRVARRELKGAIEDKVSKWKAQQEAEITED